MDDQTTANATTEEQIIGIDRADEPTPTDAPNEAGEASESKKFTQEEVNEVVRQRLKREREKMPSKEDLEAFKNWKAEQEKDKPPADPELTATRQELAKAKSELQQLKNRDSAIKAGIKPEFVDYAVFQAMQDVDDDFDFASSLSKFLKENPQFANDTAKEPATAITAALPQGMRQGSSAPKMDGVEAAFRKKNPDLFKNERNT